MTRKQWALRQMCMATELGAEITFCGLNDNTFWCIHATGGTYKTPWRCAHEYLRDEHGIRLERDGTITKVRPEPFKPYLVVCETEA